MPTLDSNSSNTDEPSVWSNGVTSDGTDTTNNFVIADAIATTAADAYRAGRGVVVATADNFPSPLRITQDLDGQYRITDGVMEPATIDELARAVASSTSEENARLRHLLDEFDSFLRTRLTPTGTRQPLTCWSCNEEIPPDDDFHEVQNGSFICGTCRENDFITCDHCGGLVPGDETWSEDDDEGNTVGTVCNNCHEDSGSPRLRPYHERASTLFQSTVAGNFIKLPRPFGVEIELVAGASDNVRQINDKLTRGWGIGTDGSIKGDNGLEIRSPILQGKAGEQSLIETCRILRNAGATVNASCGLHIHLEAREFKGRFTALKNIFLFYVLFDDILISLLPRFRRDNRFAKPMRSAFSVEDIMAAGDVSELERCWYRTDRPELVADCKRDTKGKTRYYGVNLHALLNNQGKTIEIRYHSPTLSPTKILNWVALHQAIIDKASSCAPERIAKQASLLFFEDKLAAFLDLLSLRPELRKYVTGRVAKFNPKKKELCAA